MIIDHAKRTVGLHTKPTGNVAQPGYQAKQGYPFGDDVPLPEPYPILSTKSWD